ncbi:hypothetical protein TNCV_4704671, partial [Trichonephila clavipes]
SQNADFVERMETSDNKNRCLTVRETAEQVEISTGSPQSGVLRLLEPLDLYSKCAPKSAASTSNTLGRSVSAETIRRVLRKAGYNGRVARKKPLISKRNRVKRLKFAKEHILKPQQF